MASVPKLRPASPKDIPQICDIDTDASSKFGTIPALADLADGSHGPLEAATVEEWLSSGDVYVLDDGANLLGFIALQPKDEVLYVAELSVLMSQQGRGLGGMLLEKAFDQARAITQVVGGDVAKVSLTTYPDVPWNGRWYRKHGFKEVEPHSVGPWHIEKARQDDKDLARPGFRRCCMLREEVIEERNTNT